MHIEGWDARSVGVYKGRELPNESPPPPNNPKKKDQEKEIRKRTIRRERERERETEQCVSLHKNIVLGRACNEPSIYLFLIVVHSLPLWIFGLELDLFYPLSKQFFICLDLVRRYRLHHSKWTWAPKFCVLTYIYISKFNPFNSLLTYNTYTMKSKFYI